jgi:PAS domain S-box-containing protein
MNRVFGRLLAYALLLYAALLGLIVGVQYVNYRIVIATVVDDPNGAGFLDRAERQHTLAQRLAKELLLSERAGAGAERARWKAAALATGRALREGQDTLQGDLLALGVALPAAAVSALAAIEGDLGRLAAAPAAPEASRLTDALLRAADAYQAALDGHAARLVELAQRHMRRLLGIVATASGIAIGIVLALTLLLIYPLLRRLRRSHEALSESHARLAGEVQERRLLARVTEQVSDAILICDAQGRIEYVNPAFERLTGYSMADVAGKTPHILGSGTTSRALYNGLWETISAGRPWRGQLIDRAKDGRLFEISQSITPIFEGERLTRFVGVMRDITHERALEAQLRQAHKLEAIGALAGGIAHDFNNILTPIISYTELMLKRAHSASVEHAELTRILKASQRAADLVRQIRAFSRQTDQEQKPLRLEELLREVLSLLQPTLPGSIHVALHVAEDVPPVLGNASQLHSVILNLCVNAVQAMPSGGRLTLALERVDAGAAPLLGPLPPAASLLSLTVRDTGIGMDESTQRRIFDPFFTTKDVGQGTGLGLSMVYGIVTQHGGCVQVQSRPGEGSEFRVFLPASDAMAPAVESRPGTHPPPVLTARILLVEDERQIRELAREALGAEGHRVTAAGTAEEALACLEQAQEPFELAIIDLSLPGRSGHELHEALHARRPRLAVILTSGDPGAVPAGPVPDCLFLPKPYSLGELYRSVQAALRERAG